MGTTSSSGHWSSTLHSAMADQQSADDHESRYWCPVDLFNPGGDVVRQKLLALISLNTPSALLILARFTLLSTNRSLWRTDISLVDVLNRYLWRQTSVSSPANGELQPWLRLIAACIYDTVDLMLIQCVCLIPLTRKASWPHYYGPYYGLPVGAKL